MTKKKRKPGPKRGRAALRAALAASSKRTKPIPQDPRDGPTPETMMRKLTLVGSADPALSEHPLGILRANGIIDESEYRAGCIGRDLFAKTQGIKVNGSLDQHSGTAHMSDEQTKAYETKWRNWGRARDALMTAGDRAYHAVYRVAIGDELPHWAVCNHCGAAFRDRWRKIDYDNSEWKALRDGFRVWVEFFGVEGQAAA